MVRKTKLMLEIENKIGKDLEDYLKEEYVGEYKSTIRIAEEINVGNQTIGRWLVKYGIPLRSISTSRLPKDFTKPTKEQLEKWYVEEHKSISEIAKTLSLSHSIVGIWLAKYGIQTRNNSESRLPKDFTKPTKEQLEKWYVEEHKSTSEIAENMQITNTTIRRWLNEKGISLRNNSESQLPKDFTKPTKEQLKKLYVGEHKTTIEIAEEIGVSHVTIGEWLRGYEIPTTSHYITSKSSFLNFLEQDETAKDLVAGSMVLNGNRGDIEKVLVDMYGGKFKDVSQLHNLIEESKKEMEEMIAYGITNLGAYVGEYSIKGAEIAPILAGQMLKRIPKERISASLEEKFVKMLRGIYGPLFNKNPEKVLENIQSKVNENEGKTKMLYGRLQEYYEDVLSLEGRLNNA